MKLVKLGESRAARSKGLALFTWAPALFALEVTALAVTLVLACGTAATAAPNNSAPKNAAAKNVVLFVADDLGLDAGYLGNAAVKTPHLDRLAREATRYSHAFCTTASCSASRAVILSGLYTHANGQYGHEHAYHHFTTFDNVKTLPVLLGQAGYRTARAGKFHVAPEKVYAFQQQITGGSPEKMAENCRPLLSEPSEQPFFLYFCTVEPHRPFKRDAEDEIDPRQVAVPPYLPDLPETRQEFAAYLGSVQRCDRGLGKLLELLAATGHAHDTLVIFISDNGAPFPGAKTNLYEPGMRLPCLVRLPGAKKQGHACNALINWCDLAPTILDFAGVLDSHKPAFHGRSFLSTVEQETTTGWDETYASHVFHEITMYYPMRVVRQRRYKLIWNMAWPLEFPFASDLWESQTWQATLKSGRPQYGQRPVASYVRRPQFELYDLEADPHETKNLAPDPAHAATLAALQARLKAFQQRTGDPWISKWTYE